MLFLSPPPGFVPAKKIISLVPSITELLSDLGLAQEVIGITKFCVHPRQWLHEKVRIGGTKNIHVEEIIALSPDLVIANREENMQSQVEAIANEIPVFLTDVTTIKDALQMIAEIGALTGKDKRAHEMVNQVASQLSTRPTHPTNPTIPTTPTIYLIWKDPYMSVGGDTFISHMMQAAGFQNVLAGKKRYPQISINEINSSGAEVIMLSSEPYPFKQKHVNELSSLLPGKKIILVDGEMFSWYGSRMLYAAKYFSDLRKELAF